MNAKCLIQDKKNIKTFLQYEKLYQNYVHI